MCNFLDTSASFLKKQKIREKSQTVTQPWHWHKRPLRKSTTKAISAERVSRAKSSTKFHRETNPIFGTTQSLNITHCWIVIRTLDGWATTIIRGVNRVVVVWQGWLGLRYVPRTTCAQNTTQIEIIFCECIDGSRTDSATTNVGCVLCALCVCVRLFLRFIVHNSRMKNNGFNNVRAPRYRSMGMLSIREQEYCRAPCPTISRWMEWGREQNNTREVFFRFFFLSATWWFHDCRVLTICVRNVLPATFSWASVVCTHGRGIVKIQTFPPFGHRISYSKVI